MKNEKFKLEIKAIGPLEVASNKHKEDRLLFKFLIVNSKNIAGEIESKSTKQSFKNHIKHIFRKESNK